jgi:hypothetical protein
MFRVERAWSSAPAPLSIVRPADHAVPPKRRHVFVNDREPSVSQHTAHLVQHESRILRVMQNITKQHRIETLVLYWKVTAIVRQIIDARGGGATDVETDDRRAEHAFQVMRDESVATADVENVGPRRQHIGYFKRHVVCSPDFATPSHPLEAALDGCAWSFHRPGLVQARCLKEMPIK